MEGDLKDEADEIVQSPETENKEETEEKDAAKVKIPLSRSVSCGSILQGNAVTKMKNLTRRVSFPADDKLISGYNEPRNPWEHAHGTTTEDLIQAYTQSCQSWNVRPITKLLLQLQEITDFTVRANSLTLKGEKLEMRVVETLESIFKRVQFVTIDLEATNLDEDAGASLFDMIEYYESAVNVLAGFNKNLGTRGWQAAAHMMRKMSCLRLFDGHSVPLSIQASPFVGRALRLSNTLVTLHLENAMLTGRPLLLIVTALRMNTTLKELFLADNRFAPLDALQLANLLKFNRILQLLDLRNNPIQDLGLGHLCAGLMAQSGSPGLNGATGGLQTLVLWNNQISHEGMAKLAMALRYTVSLSTINLGQNVLGDDGILRLKEGLLQNHSLLRLGLVGTKMTDEGAVAVAEYLAESPRIIRLDLRNNNIKVAGLMALSLAFKINSSLLRLDIDKPNKKDALKELAAKQESLLNDIVSYAARNKQTALEKSAAAQARQEAARRSQAKEESELRYMDMTNATVSSASEQASANNSNNLSPDTKHRVLGAKGAIPMKVQGDVTPIYPTVTPDTDDTPEDSPEFLPRSSVSYHQVAPVMLSNSEIVKRAAAAKLTPLHERDVGAPANDHKNVDNAFKIVDDAYTGAKEAIASMGHSCDGTNAHDGNLPTQDQSIHPGFEETRTSSDSIDSTGPGPSQRQENLDVFAARLTEVVLTNAATRQAPIDAATPPSNPGDAADLQSVGVPRTPNLGHTTEQRPTHIDTADHALGAGDVSCSVSMDEEVEKGEFRPANAANLEPVSRDGESVQDVPDLDFTADREVQINHEAFESATVPSTRLPVVGHPASSTEYQLEDRYESSVEVSTTGRFDVVRHPVDPALDTERPSDSKDVLPEDVDQGTTTDAMEATISQLATQSDTGPCEAADLTPAASSMPALLDDTTLRRPEDAQCVIFGRTGEDVVSKNAQAFIPESPEEFPVSEEDAAIQNLVNLATESTAAERLPTDQCKPDVMKEDLTDNSSLNAERHQVDHLTQNTDSLQGVQYEHENVDVSAQNTRRPPVDQKPDELKGRLEDETLLQESTFENAARATADDITSQDSKETDIEDETVLESASRESPAGSRLASHVSEVLELSADDSKLANSDAVAHESQFFDSKPSNDDITLHEFSEPQTQSLVTQIESGILPDVCITNELGLSNKPAQPHFDSLSEDLTSGCGTEDNSTISGDLSPLEDKNIDKGFLSSIAGKTGLLTPDSGVVHFEEGENVATHKNIRFRGSHDEGCSHDEKREMKALKKEAESGDNDISLTKNSTFLSPNEGEDSQNRLGNIHNSNFVENRSSADKNAAENEIFEQSCNSAQNQPLKSHGNDSQCEIEISHYDLAKFSSHD